MRCISNGNVVSSKWKALLFGCIAYNALGMCMPSVIYAEENKELFFDIANTGDKYEYSDYNLLKSNIDGSNTTAPNNGMFLSNSGKNQNIILKNIDEIASKNSIFYLKYNNSSDNEKQIQTITLSNIGKITGTTGVVFVNKGNTNSKDINNDSYQVINIETNELNGGTGSKVNILANSPLTYGVITNQSGFQLINGNIGKITVDENGYGVAIIAGGNASNSVFDQNEQRVNAIVGNIGDSSTRFKIGIAAYRNVNQIINRIGDIYAKEYGVMTYQNETGASDGQIDKKEKGQYINSVDNINVNNSDVNGRAYGIYNWSDTGNKFYGKQHVGVTGSIIVNGAKQGVAIWNQAGLQTIESKNKNGVDISANSLSIYMRPMINNTNLASRPSVISETELKGNFNIKKGNININPSMNYTGTKPLEKGLSILNFSRNEWGDTITLSDNIDILIKAGNNTEKDNTRLKLSNAKIAMNKNNRIDVRGAFQGNGTIVYNNVRKIEVKDPIHFDSEGNIINDVIDDNENNGKYPSKTEDYYVVDNGTKGGVYLDKIYKANGTKDNGINSSLDISINAKKEDGTQLTSDDVPNKASAFWLLKSAANSIFANEGIENMETSMVLENGKKAVGRVYLQEGLVHKYSTRWYFENTEDVEYRDNSHLTANEKDPTKSDGGDYFKYEGNILKIDDEETSTMAGVDSSYISNYFFWRDEIETLSQRLGEIRDLPRLQGDWMRVYGGNNSYTKHNYYFYNKYRAVQFGYDRAQKKNPMGIYSKSIENLKYVPDGAKVAISDNSINRGLSLELLQSAKLIKLRNDVKNNATLDDIIENSKNLQFIETDESMLPEAVESFDLSLVSSEIMKNSEVDPAENLLFTESTWTYGGSFSYTDGESKLKNGGSGENWIATGSLYASRASKNGEYVDYIGKVSRMHNDFEVIADDYQYNTKGNNSNWAYQLSAEYGRKFENKKGYFIDPQVQVIYGHISGSNYKTDNGINVRHDSTDSLIGRLGISMGRKNPSSSYFVRVDWLKEFRGDTNAIFSLNGDNPNSSNIKLAETWGEISIGGSRRFNEDLMGYIQVKRSFRSDYETKGRIDIGLRYSF
jgi:hypothetical protein